MKIAYLSVAYILLNHSITFITPVGLQQWKLQHYNVTLFVMGSQPEFINFTTLAPKDKKRGERREKSSCQFYSLATS